MVPARCPSTNHRDTVADSLSQEPPSPSKQALALLEQHKKNRAALFQNQQNQSAPEESPVVVPLPPRPFLGILDNPLLDNQAVETRDDGGQGNTSGKPPIPERRLARMPDIPTNELGRSWDGGGEVEHKDGQASSVPSSPEGSSVGSADSSESGAEDASPLGLRGRLAPEMLLGSERKRRSTKADRLDSIRQGRKGKNQGARPMRSNVDKLRRKPFVSTPSYPPHSLSGISVVMVIRIARIPEGLPRINILDPVAGDGGRQD